MSDTNRAAFEKWALTCDGNCNEINLQLATDGESVYKHPQVDRDFMVWQAARAQPATIGTADLIDRLHASIGDTESYEFKSVSVANIRAAIALLSAQPFERVALSNAEIRDILMAHGFKIHEEVTDLKPYVYEAVREVLAAQAEAMVKPCFTISDVREGWRAAVTDACTIACIGWQEDDPRKSVNDLIDWHVAVALDPAVSEAAQADTMVRPRFTIK